MNVKWILSRKSNYQLCSKWQVRMKNVREKFLPLFVPFTQLSSTPSFKLTRTIFRRIHIWKRLLSRSLIKFSRQLQFQKFSKNEFSPPPIVLMEKVRLFAAFFLGEQEEHNLFSFVELAKGDGKFVKLRNIFCFEWRNDSQESLTKTSDDWYKRILIDLIVSLRKIKRFSILHASTFEIWLWNPISLASPNFWHKFRSTRRFK